MGGEEGCFRVEWIRRVHEKGRYAVLSDGETERRDARMFVTKKEQRWIGLKRKNGYGYKEEGKRN